MSWHWESYVHKNNLWHHFQTFSEAIKGINPIEEQFVPAKAETNTLRIYLLKGKKTTLVWLRDKKTNWESELERRTAPETLHDLSLDLRELSLRGSAMNIEVYDPWKNKWSKIKNADTSIFLPDFKRSIVLRFHSK